MGLYLGKWRLKRSPDVEKIDIGPVVTACLTLLAFILAMVFSAVYSRYNELKHAVLDEANAIGTAYLRVDLLPDVERVEVQRLLRRLYNRAPRGLRIMGIMNKLNWQ